MIVGARYVATVTDRGFCAVWYSVLISLVSFLLTVPPTFSMLSKLATATAIATFISLLLSAIFIGVESHPAGYNSGILSNGVRQEGSPSVLAFPASSTSFVAGFNAFLNVLYIYTGQITIPSYIRDMKDPRDFPKALGIVTLLEVMIFTTIAVVIYVYTGGQYVTSPAFASISNQAFKVTAFSFMVPNLFFIGALFTSVSARFLFFNLPINRHKTSHNLTTWFTWGAIVAFLWVLNFLVTQLVPIFGDLLSLVSAFFNPWWGFVFWGLAILRFREVDMPDHLKNFGVTKNLFCAGVLLVFGLFVFGAGAYVSIQAINKAQLTWTQTSVQSTVNDVNGGLVDHIFTCQVASL